MQLFKHFPISTMYNYEFCALRLKTGGIKNNIAVQGGAIWNIVIVA